MKGKSMIVVVLAMVLLPAWAMAGSVEGSVQGFTCVNTGKVCPIGQEDPMIAVEKIFGVFTADGKFYFVPNLDRAILAKYINQKVRVTGEVNEKYKSIQADKLEVYKDGQWALPWSQELQDAIEESLMTVPR